jgi:hypothetical protein
VAAPVKDEESEEPELKESAENAESSAEVAADSSLKLATQQEDSSSPTTGLQYIF